MKVYQWKYNTLKVELKFLKFLTLFHRKRDGNSKRHEEFYWMTLYRTTPKKKWDEPQGSGRN